MNDLDKVVLLKFPRDMLVEVELLDESYLQIEFQNFDIHSFLNSIHIFLRIPEFSGVGLNYIDNDGHYMWLPFEGSFYDIDFHKRLPFIALFLRIRFFASDILRVSPVESVFQYFLYGVSSLSKLELPKNVFDQLSLLKSFILTGSKIYMNQLGEYQGQKQFDILRGFSDSDLTCRGEALLRFLEFLYRLPCFNGHFYEFENIEEGKIFLIVILPTGLRRFQVLKRTHDINEESLIPWKKIRSIFVEDDFLIIEHTRKTSSDDKSKLLTTSWLCPSHWHATNLCAEVIHQRLWHIAELKQDEGTYKIEKSPAEARICRAFELSSWLSKHYPSKSSRRTPAHLADSGGGPETSPEETLKGGGVEKTPRTRRRDARRAAHRSQKTAPKDQDDSSSMETSSEASQWNAAKIASQFVHITGSEAKKISETIESWQLTDRQHMLDTSLSMSELNALGGIDTSRKQSLPPLTPSPTNIPPPRPPETYRRASRTRAQTEQPRRDTRDSSRGATSRLLGFLKWPEIKKKLQPREEREKSTPKPMSSKEEEKKELLNVAAELKWLIAENCRQLTELCREEERLTGRLPSICIPECKAGHSREPLTVITRSITCQSPNVQVYDTPTTPRSFVSTGQMEPGNNESWVLKRMPPRAGSLTNAPLSSSSSISSPNRLGHQSYHNDYSGRNGAHKPTLQHHSHSGKPKSEIGYCSHLSQMRSIRQEETARPLPGDKVSCYHNGDPTGVSGTYRQRSEPPLVTANTPRGTTFCVAHPPASSHANDHRSSRKCNHIQYYNNCASHYHQPNYQQRTRKPRPPSYEMGDDTAMEQLYAELQGSRRTQQPQPQWSLAFPSSKPAKSSQHYSALSRREKTPGPQRSTFYIGLGDLRQSCPPLSHPNNNYDGRCSDLSPATEEKGSGYLIDEAPVHDSRRRIYIQPKGREVYREVLSPSGYPDECNSRYSKQPYRAEGNIHREFGFSPGTHISYT